MSSQKFNVLVKRSMIVDQRKKNKQAKALEFGSSNCKNKKSKQAS